MPTVMIRIDPEIKKRLDAIRVHHRETYGDIIGRLLEAFPDAGNAGMNSYPKFSQDYRRSRDKEPGMRTEIEID